MEWANVDYDTADPTPRPTPSPTPAPTPRPTPAASDNNDGILINYDACWNAGYKDWVATRADCERTCGNTPGCVSYGYNAYLSYNRCHLCTRDTPRTELSCAAGEVCGYWGLIDPNKDYSGPPDPITLTNLNSCWDIGYQDNLESREQCESICGITEGCLTYSYHNNRSNKRCDMCSWETAYFEEDCAEGQICTEWGRIDLTKTYESPS